MSIGEHSSVSENQPIATISGSRLSHHSRKRLQIINTSIAANVWMSGSSTQLLPAPPKDFNLPKIVIDFVSAVIGRPSHHKLFLGLLGSSYMSEY